MGMESPSGGCNLSSKLSCGVEELKSSVDIMAKTCAYDDDNGIMMTTTTMSNSVSVLYTALLLLLVSNSK